MEREAKDAGFPTEASVSRVVAAHALAAHQDFPGSKDVAHKRNAKLNEPIKLIRISTERADYFCPASSVALT